MTIARLRPPTGTRLPPTNAAIEGADGTILDHHELQLPGGVGVRAVDTAEQVTAEVLRAKAVADDPGTVIRVRVKTVGPHETVGELLARSLPAGRQRWPVVDEEAVAKTLDVVGTNIYRERQDSMDGMWQALQGANCFLPISGSPSARATGATSETRGKARRAEARRAARGIMISPKLMWRVNGLAVWRPMDVYMAGALDVLRRTRGQVCFERSRLAD